jgi:DNA-binding NarL/FixJ family response regulator
MAARERPDAIVLDIGIAGVDGIGILPSLRALLPSARIIVFTGHDDAQMREQAMQAGASAWVLKGGDLNSLLDELGLTLTEQKPPARQ